MVLQTGALATTVEPMAATPDVTYTPAPTGHSPSTDQTPHRRTFWAILVFATITSIIGNVTHALLTVQERSTLMLTVAAAVAVIPPIVLLLATHSVGLLVRSINSGWVYKAAVMITVTLATFAFRLSFDALKELAIHAGVRNSIAWLWPLTVDLSIGQATLALLSLDRPKQRPRTQQTPEEATEGERDVGGQGNDRPHDISAKHVTQLGNSSNNNHNGRKPELHITADSAAPAAGGVRADLWSDVAETLVREKVTSKSVEKTADVLRLWDQRIPPTTIASRTGIHRDTVSNIISGAEGLLSTADRLHA
ncbi:Protein of uncharacterised function (DUF2637) [Mycobacteroides abscessus subsp. abscessus]|nr:Protein of uncharacterised function (DUF2637) [Mycobacteroides abscessus subsp. abscessus]SIM32092.1 Protein of uncharacterised function (DUF2637) [Mycobacteroides abscessus subsp. abscessus]